MTDRLYYADAYLTRFEARVIARGDDGRRLYLDRSAFYPTSGGQPHDEGTLGGVAVTDVVDEEDGRVAHLVAEVVTGDVVEGVVDWRRRWDHMQQHTGQHLLSAIVADTFGWETLSVHFGPAVSTLDLATETVAPSALLEIERLANRAVTENHLVTVTLEDAATTTGLRKPTERSGSLRIVAIEGLDRSACGGTHVRSTGAIGAILLRRVEKVRKATRVEFICGDRAIARARSDYDILARLAQGLSCSIDELATIVPAQTEQLRTLDHQWRRLDEEVSGTRARDRYAALTPDAGGVRRLLDRRSTGKADDARAMALAFCSLPRTLFAVVVASPPAILVAASDDSGVDAGRTLKAALGLVGGRGGGSARLAQGTVPAAELLGGVLAAFGFDAPSPSR